MQYFKSNVYCKIASGTKIRLHKFNTQISRVHKASTFLYTQDKQGKENHETCVL